VAEAAVGAVVAGVAAGAVAVGEVAAAEAAAAEAGAAGSGLERSPVAPRKPSKPKRTLPRRTHSMREVVVNAVMVCGAWVKARDGQGAEGDLYGLIRVYTSIEKRHDACGHTMGLCRSEARQLRLLRYCRISSMRKNKLMMSRYSPTVAHTYSSTEWRRISSLVS
jgi:hypothetical protein